MPFRRPRARRGETAGGVPLPPLRTRREHRSGPGKGSAGGPGDSRRRVRHLRPSLVTGHGPPPPGRGRGVGPPLPLPRRDSRAPGPGRGCRPTGPGDRGHGGGGGDARRLSGADRPRARERDLVLRLRQLLGNQRLRDAIGTSAPGPRPRPPRAPGDGGPVGDLPRGRGHSPQRVRSRIPADRSKTGAWVDTSPTRSARPGVTWGWPALPAGTGGPPRARSREARPFALAPVDRALRRPSRCPDPVQAGRRARRGRSSRSEGEPGPEEGRLGEEGPPERRIEGGGQEADVGAHGSGGGGPGSRAKREREERELQ